jgi:ornithine cyclodeaminase/alanine dehydrogenase
MITPKIGYLGQPLLYLSEDVLEGLGVTTEDAVAAIEHLVKGHAQAKVWYAPKVVVQPDERYMMATMAAADDPPFLAVKSLVLNPRNSGRGLKQINALVTLLDSETGLPLAVIDGNWVTAVRTAALSAVAAKRLARPNASIAAFIGCGVQAQSHLKAFAALYPLRQIRAFGRGRANIDALCKSGQKLGLTAIASPSAKDAVTDADIVITTVTLSAELEPFVDAGWLKPGAFAAITDFAVPWKPDSIAKFERIIIDDLEQEASMESPLVKPGLVAGDLSGLVLGKVAGRGNDAERTAFIFRAHPLGDLALAALAYQKAVEQSEGTPIGA